MANVCVIIEAGMRHQHLVCIRGKIFVQKNQNNLTHTPVQLKVDYNTRRKEQQRRVSVIMAAKKS